MSNSAESSLPSTSQSAPPAASAARKMEAILRFDAPLDVALLDRVVLAMHRSPEPERSQADRVLTAFREHAEAWTRVDAVLESAGSSVETKFFALQILESMIKYRWKSLPAEQREGIKMYLVQKIVTVRSGSACAPVARALARSSTRSVCFASAPRTRARQHTHSVRRGAAVTPPRRGCRSRRRPCWRP